MLSALRRAVGEGLRRLGLRAAALDYRTPAAPVAADGPPGAVDIIVPVHGGGEVVGDCLRSVLANTDLERHVLLVVVDGDPSFDAEDLLAGREGVRVLHNATQQGFVVSVNRGMAVSEQDVILLNSDTVVTRGWVEKMQRAAYSDAAVATVTPFSNNATICSLPRPLVANALPLGLSLDRFADLVEEAAMTDGGPRYPRLPSGVGMCLYIKRKALDQLGLFDVQRFGVGYGEETEFCMRALLAGYVHVLDDATFIFHHGQCSFGARRSERVRRAEQQLRRMVPAYRPTLGRFLREDPLREVRQRVLDRLPTNQASGSAVRNSGPRRVLHLVHGWPPYSHAGTELYAAWLAGWQKRRREVAIYARLADPSRELGEATELLDDGMRVRLVVNNFTARNPVVRNALLNPRLQGDFDAFLDEVAPDLVHVHHLAGHAFSLLAPVLARRLPLVYQIQDWWALCARVNLLQPDRSICPGPTPARCAACLPMTAIPPVRLWSNLLYRYRRHLARHLLRRADAYVMGSRFIAESYRDAGLLREADAVHILPYGVAQPPASLPRPTPRRPLRFGYIGSILPHKGVHVAAAAFANVDPHHASLELWGDTSISPAYTEELQSLAPPRVLRFHSTFAEAEKALVFASIDVLLVPSLGYESFGLVAREALAHGVPVLASQGSALAELFAGNGEEGGGAFFPPGDVEALRRWIERLIAAPEQVAAWARRMPHVVGLEEHAEAMEDVYRQVLAQRGRT